MAAECMYNTNKTLRHTTYS